MIKLKQYPKGGSENSKETFMNDSHLMNFLTKEDLTMKRVLVLMLGGLLIFSLTSFAGEYHRGSSLSCYQCHTMHFSQSHAFGYSHETYPGYLGAAGPYNGLLKGPVNDLCLSCHNGGDVIDVYGVSEVNPTVNREAGALNRLGDGNENNGHTLDALSEAPGSVPAWSDANGLNCADCHNPHGSIGRNINNYPDSTKGQWRNLKTNPGNATLRFLNYDKTGETVYPNPARDIHWSAASVHAADAYETDAVNFFEPSQTESRFGAWCQGCHTNFHGNSTDPNMANGDGWLRHPTADANIGGSRLTQFANHLYRPQVMSSTGDWGTQGTAWSNPPADLTPSCFTCHKGHGNGNAFGLMYMTGDAARSENGDGTRITATCSVCHTQGN